MLSTIEKLSARRGAQALFHGVPTHGKKESQTFDKLKN